MTTYIKEETLGQRIRAQRIRMGWTQEELLETTPNHLLGTGEYDTDILEILGVLKKMSPKLKKVALEQIKALSSVC